MPQRKQIRRRTKRRIKRKKHHPLRALFFVLLFVGIAFVLWRVLAPYGLSSHARHINPILDAKIRHYAEQQELDADLVRAVIEQESRFDPNATSRVGAQGLMQLMPETASDIADMRGEATPENLYDTDVNLAYGTTYLRYLLDRFDGIIPTALAAYNAGPTVVAQWLEDPTTSKDGATLSFIPYDETRVYVDKVLSYYDDYRDASRHAAP